MPRHRASFNSSEGVGQRLMLNSQHEQNARGISVYRPLSLSREADVAELMTSEARLSSSHKPSQAAAGCNIWHENSFFRHNSRLTQMGQDTEYDLGAKRRAAEKSSQDGWRPDGWRRWCSGARRGARGRKVRVAHFCVLSSELGLLQLVQPLQHDFKTIRTGRGGGGAVCWETCFLLDMSSAMRIRNSSPYFIFLFALLEHQPSRFPPPLGGHRRPDAPEHVVSLLYHGCAEGSRMAVGLGVRTPPLAVLLLLSPLATEASLLDGAATGCVGRVSQHCLTFSSRRRKSSFILRMKSEFCHARTRAIVLLLPRMLRSLFDSSEETCTS